jgi:hypothetical protein
MMQLQDSVNGMAEVLNSFIGEFSAWRHDVENRILPRRAFENTLNVASPETAIAAPLREAGNLRMPTLMQAKNGALCMDRMKVDLQMGLYLSPGRA